MYHTEKDKLPEVKRGASFSCSHARPTIGKKLHDIKVYKKEQSFNQTELAELEGVSHQRISIVIKTITTKAREKLQEHPEHMEVLLNNLQ